MRLFQIEEPDGSPSDPDMPGAAVGIDASGEVALVALAVGGNAAVLADREGFEQILKVPPHAASAAEWQSLFEGARMRAERALARPVTHAVIVLAAETEAPVAGRIGTAAQTAGLSVLRLIAPAGGETPVLAAAVLAEDLAPRS